MAKITLIDSEGECCSALQQGLQRHGHEVRRFRNAEQALASLAHWHAAVAVVDETMSGMDGFTCINRLETMSRDTRYVITTNHAGWNCFSNAQAYGVKAIMQKPFSPGELMTVIDLILQTTPSAKELMNSRMLFVSGNAHANKSRDLELSEREVIILNFLKLRFSDKRIAEALKLAPQTVRNYLQQIYRKLEVRDRKAAVRKWFG